MEGSGRKWKEGEGSRRKWEEVGGIGRKWEEVEGSYGTRVTLKLSTPTFPNKTKDLFISLRFNYFKVFTVGVESFFRPFEPRPEEMKKDNF